MPSDAAPRPWREALAVYAHPRVLGMLLLGFSAGLPFLLVFQTLSAWLTQAGLTRSAIGFFSWVGFTYSLKIFWAPVVDRLPLPLLTRALGRRRSWMLLAQCGIALGLAGMALTDPAQATTRIVIFSIMVAFSSATQDIALDAYRIEAAALELQGAMAAAYQMGYRVALITAGAGALYIASAAGWKTAYFSMAALVSVGLVTTLLISEPDAAPRPATTVFEHDLVQSRRVRLAVTSLLLALVLGLGVIGAQGNPVVLAVLAFLLAAYAIACFTLGPRRMMDLFIASVAVPLADVFRRYGVREALIILLFVSVYRMHEYAMGVMCNPFYLDMGYSLDQIATMSKLFGIIMTMVGVAIAGTLVAWRGVAYTLFVGVLLIGAGNLFYSVLAMSQPGLAGLAAAISVDNVGIGIAGTAFVAYLSSLTNSAYTATQYALFGSLFPLPGKFVAGFSGVVVDAVGYPLFFIYTALLTLPALLLARRFMRLSAARPAGA